MTALVGPYFVDWTAYKATFEKYASRVVQADVQVAGEVDLRLLPEPRFRLTDVRIGAEDQPLVTVGTFDMLVALAPLLSGEVEVLQLRLDRPKATATLGPGGRLVLPERIVPSDVEMPEFDNIVFTDVALTNGVLTVRDETSGWSTAVNGLDLEFTAPSLQGPYKLIGIGLVDGAPLDISLATGAWQQDNTLRLTSRLAPAIGGTAFSTDGKIEWDAEAHDFAYDGQFTIAPAVISSDAVEVPSVAPTNTAASPFNAFDGAKIDGSFRLTAERLLIKQAQVNIGADDDALAVDVVGGLDIGAAPRFQAVVTSKQLDADRVLGASAAEPLTVMEVSERVAARMQQLPSPGFPGDVSFDIPGLVVGGGIIRNLRFDATTNGQAGGWRIDAIEASLPGETTISAVGQMDGAAQDGISFDGHVRVSSRRPSVLASWYQADGETSTTVLPSVELSGDLIYGDQSIALSDAEFTSGEATLYGTLAWQAVSNRDRESLFANFDGDQVDLDTLLLFARTASSLLIAEPVSDDGTRLSTAEPGIPNLDVRISAGQMTYSGLEADAVNVEATFVNDKLTLTNLAVGNVAGIGISARGVVEDVSTTAVGSLEMEMTADTLEPLIDLLERRRFEAPVVQWLAAAAPALGGTELKASLRAAARDNGTRAELVVNGKAGDTNVDGRVRFDGQLADWRKGKVDLQLSAANADDFRLARQIGIEPNVSPAIEAGFAVPEAQPGSLSLAFNGRLTEPLTGRLQADLFGIDSQYIGFLEIPRENQAASVSGRILAKTANAARLWKALGAVPPWGEYPAPIDLVGVVAGGIDELAFTELAGTIAGSEFTGALTLAKTIGPWSVKGNVSSTSLSLPALLSLAVTPTNTALSESGDATASPWPTYVFGPAALNHIMLDIGFAARSLAAGAIGTVDDASLRLSYNGGIVQVSDLVAKFADGDLTGAARVDQINGTAKTSLQVNLKDADLTALLPTAYTSPITAGRVNLALDLDGLGGSVASLAASLSGTGAASLEQARLQGISPQAFDAVIQAVDAEAVAIEDEAIAAFFAAALAGGALDVPSAEAALSIGGGKLRARNVALGVYNEVLADATVDLADMSVSADWTITGRTKGDNDLVPQAIVRFSGPLSNPQREIDASPLTAFLTLRNVEKQVDTIEELEAEREREEEKLRTLQEETRLRAQEAAQQAAAQAEARRAAANQSTLAPITETVTVTPVPNGTGQRGNPLPLVLDPPRSQPLNLLAQ